MQTVVDCPTCGKSVPWGPESPWRPFCSDRCKLIDLGDWFEERNSIPDGADGESSGQEWLPPEDSGPERP